MTDFEKICSFEALYKAHRRARLGKRDKAEVIKFEMRLSESLYRLKCLLESGEYRVANYLRFTIHDPKTREIQALPYHDRVVQHSLCGEVLAPYFERRLIYDNAACRKGKGTHFAMDRLSGFFREHYKKHGHAGYVLKCDIAKFFDTIDHDVLKAKLLKCKFEAKLTSLLFKIIDSYHKTYGKGLPMGNQTSQYFALLYLDGMDRLVKEKLQVKHYVRYMDDFLLVHHDKRFLEKCLTAMNNLVEGELKLKFNPKTRIIRLKEGISFLGFKFYLVKRGKVIRLLSYEKKAKIIRVAKKLNILPKTMSEYKNIRFNSIKSYLAHGNQHGVIRQMEQRTNGGRSLC